MSKNNDSNSKVGMETAKKLCHFGAPHERNIEF